ncbi:glutaredoxin family protein [Actinoplanes palleronii]|uniref:glutaredoxin family protein n=1 Tax=Actinoplanes palleronii TaxID=113570 RepID=UPI00194426DB|nr:glutaredoxin domain-containing protein [Actinoplanes palleronii]
MARRWRLAVICVACGVAVSGLELARGRTGTAVAMLVFFLVMALVASPLIFPGATAAPDGAPVVYWRPGCPFCLRLRAQLGADGARLTWVDIWQDPAGAAVVRGITGGDETVPTVVIGGEGFVNPDPRWLRERLRTA